MSISFKFIDVSAEYALGKKLGGGSFGTVYLGTNNRTGEQVAVKVIKNALSNASEEAAFINEIQTLNAIQHRCVHRLICCQKSPKKEVVTAKWTGIPYSGGPLIVTELMTNGTVQDIAKRFISTGGNDPIATPTCLSKIIYGMAEGMAVLHSKNIIHRDLKPENVFLNSNNEPVVADFGLAVKFSAGSGGAGAGTPMFMCPESMKKANSSVDIWAFGITLVFLFTNDYKPNDGKPFEWSGVGFQWMSRLEAGVRPSKPDLMPQKLFDVAQMCWDKDPSKRPHYVRLMQMLENPEYWVPGTDQTEMLNYIHPAEYILKTMKPALPNEEGIVKRKIKPPPDYVQAGQWMPPPVSI